MLEERFLSRKHPLIGYFHRAPTFSRRHFLMSSQSELDREKALRYDDPAVPNCTIARNPCSRAARPCRHRARARLACCGCV
jgi:hypothetical protein